MWWSDPPIGLFKIVKHSVLNVRKLKETKKILQGFIVNSAELTNFPHGSRF
jgi:hypothetical protein